MTDARHAIEALLHAYADCIDRGDFAGVGALFADGAIGAPGVPPVRGRDAVRDLYARTVRLHGDGTPRTAHVTTNVVLDVDEAAGTARGRARFTVLQELEDFPLQLVIAGRYEDTFARAGGRWHFRERLVIPTLRGDLSRHLLIDLPSTPAP